MKTVNENKRCWVITDGRAGMVAGALGLAEAVGLPIEEKVIRLAFPWRYLPPALWPQRVLGIDPIHGDRLDPPWPELVISCGRQAVGPAAEIRRRSGGKTVAVHVQHPRVPLDRFDLIAAPVHDGLNGANVIATHGALGRITPDRVRTAAEKMAGRFDGLPDLKIAVSIGGNSRVYQLTDTLAADIGRQLADMARETGAALLVTASRRTGVEATAALRQALKDTPGEFWDGSGDNPYFAYLGVADTIIVTGDSVNMVSEACATGKPVKVIHLPSKRHTKFDIFHQDMEKIGATRPFDGSIERWDYSPLDETGRVAEAVRTLMREKGLLAPARD